MMVMVSPTLCALQSAAQFWELELQSEPFGVVFPFVWDLQGCDIKIGTQTAK